jgi:hypothetical protein
MEMRVNHRSLASAVALLCCASFAGSIAGPASAAIITSAIKENGSAFNQPTGGPYVFTSGLGFDFSADAATVASLTTIDELVLTLTVNDGDSDVGNFDENNLFLTLDGFNTGVTLNGYTNGQIVTIDFDQLNPSNAAAILAALKVDNRLVGSVLDIDADGPAGDTIGFPGAINTTLSLVGVPEPSGLALLLAAPAVAILRRRRRSRVG